LIQSLSRYEESSISEQSDDMTRIWTISDVKSSAA